MMHKTTKLYWENAEINGEANCISENEDNSILNKSDNSQLSLQLSYSHSELTNMISFINGWEKFLSMHWEQKVG